MSSEHKSSHMNSSPDGRSSPPPTSPKSNGGSDSSAASASTLPRLRCCLTEAMPETNIDEYAVTFKFLNDGAANAVFRILPCSLREAPGFVFKKFDELVPRSEMLGKVLRISKGKPKTLSSDEVVHAFDDQIRPLFRSTVSDLKTVKPDPLSIVSATSLEHFLLDHELVDLEKSVFELVLLPQLGMTRLPGEQKHPYRGIILPDMSAVPGVSLTVEIKPKWLAQSPNAPRYAYRCRNCALHAKRLATASVPPPPYVCPLQLMSGKSPLIERVIKDKLTRHYSSSSPTLSPDAIPTATSRAVEYLVTGPGAALLAHLRTLQLELDPIGVGYLLAPGDVVDAGPRQHRLRLAMTLRDCSLFLRVPYAGAEDLPVEAKLVDLDFKSLAKLPDWARKEEGLRNGGWYTDLGAGVDHCAVAQERKVGVPYWM